MLSYQITTANDLFYLLHAIRNHKSVRSFFIIEKVSIEIQVRVKWW